MTTISGEFGAQTISNFKECNCVSAGCLPHVALGQQSKGWGTRKHAFSTDLAAAASSDSGITVC